MANDRMDFLTKQVAGFEQKISEHGQAINRLKERINEARKEIFDLDEGRFLEAAHAVAAAHPEFEALLKIARGKIELRISTPMPETPGAAKRGRPKKAQPGAAVSEETPEQQAAREIVMPTQAINPASKASKKP